MAAAAESSSAHSPRFRRGAPTLSSPWSRVVRGGEYEAAPSSPSPPPEPSGRSPPAHPADAAGAPPPPPSDGVEQGAGGDAVSSSWEKKPAWSRPSNGVAETGAVMGADSWPALSEAAKAPAKSSSYDSLKGLANGSVPASPAPVATSPPPKMAPSNATSSSSINHAAPIRQKSMKRGGGSGADSTIANTSGGASANGRPVTPKTQPISSEVSRDASDKLVNSEASPRELAGRSGGWDHGSRVGGLSPQSRVGGGRRGNSSGGSGGHHHNNFGNRHDHERGGYDGNRRSFGSGRDVQVQQQQQPRSMARPFFQPPPPGSAPFVSPPPPPPPHPFASPIGYHDITSPVFYVPPRPPPESFRGMPFAAPPAMFFAPPDLQLRAVLLQQIEYYFSSENLCKDVYLRQNMDEEGWVPISLIAGFNRVRKLTNNIQFILETVRTSTMVEVQGDKIRRCNDWKNWPALTRPPNPPNSSMMPNYDALAAHLSHVRMEEGNTGQNSRRGVAQTEVVLSRSSSGDFNSQVQVVGRSAQGTAQIGSDRSISARSLSRSDTF